MAYPPFFPRARAAGVPPRADAREFSDIDVSSTLARERAFVGSLLLRVVTCAAVLAPTAACNTSTVARDSADGSGNGNVGDDANAGGNSDAGDGGDDGDAAPCSTSVITFNLNVDSTAPVYFGGPQPPWLDSFACPSWLAISPAGGPPLTLVQACNHSCPRAEPEPPTTQSYAWDGTIFVEPANAYLQYCDRSCVSPGNYVATLCVGYADPDAGTDPETAPPTCTVVPFVWPPATTNQSIDVTITPMPDGG